ncbi:hypothetical protein [Vibrio gallicus]|uniref:hypothetical protein n=1 Tax=Vibrio gallicus TaxID=190897 RepID=UPI0021C43AEA|nr:hypothetical protein [Vibrio gallicus]
MAILVRAVLCMAGLLLSTVTYANVHQWQQTEYQTYSDKTHVKFTLINRYDGAAKYYIRIDDKRFPNPLILQANQKKELDITVNTPPGTTTHKRVCTRMDTGAQNQYEVCTRLSFKRF